MMEFPEDPFSEAEMNLLLMDACFGDSAVRADAPKWKWEPDAVGGALTPEMVDEALRGMWSAKLRPPPPGW